MRQGPAALPLTGRPLRTHPRCKPDASMPAQHQLLGHARVAQRVKWLGPRPRTARRSAARAGSACDQPQRLPTARGPECSIRRELSGRYRWGSGARRERCPCPRPPTARPARQRVVARISEIPGGDDDPRHLPGLHRCVTPPRRFQAFASASAATSPPAVNCAPSRNSTPHSSCHAGSKPVRSHCRRADGPPMIFGSSGPRSMSS